MEGGREEEEVEDLILDVRDEAKLLMETVTHDLGREGGNEGGRGEG